MKNLYTFLFAMVIGSFAFAQDTYEVTLSVDMNNEVVAAEGVHVAGSFQGWDAATSPMDDADEDGVYEITLMLEAGDYEFKFINGNDFMQEETVPDACRADLMGNTNRKMTVSGDMTYAVCFGSCAPCGMSAVLLRVDMSLQTVVPEGVHVAGNFQGWEPGDTPLSDEDGDEVWTALITFDGSMLEPNADELQFKFINGNSWLFDNESVPNECGSGTGDRVLVVTESNTVTDAYCYNLCGPCVAPLPVTFRVNMANEDVSPEGVYIAGAFQGWSDSSTQMSDDDEDGIYEYTTDLAPGTYQFKFLNGPGGWEAVPGACAQDANRFVEVVDEELSYLACFNQCAEECSVDPEPANITFRVNMQDEVVSADGVYLIGQFTDPAWQAGATQMLDDDEDGIYEATVEVSGAAEFQYKYTNGDPYPDDTVDNSVEESYDFETGGCGVSNGLGGFNRVHVRTGEPEVLDIVCYNSCVACGEGVNGISLDGSFQAYPNPANNVLFFTSAQMSGMAQVNLFDTQGRLVINTTMAVQNAVPVAISLDALENGYYTLQVVNQNIMATSAVIKK